MTLLLPLNPHAQCYPPVDLFSQVPVLIPHLPAIPSALLFCFSNSYCFSGFRGDAPSSKKPSWTSLLVLSWSPTFPPSKHWTHSRYSINICHLDEYLPNCPQLGSLLSSVPCSAPAFPAFSFLFSRSTPCTPVVPSSKFHISVFLLHFPLQMGSDCSNVNTKADGPERSISSQPGG